MMSIVSDCTLKGAACTSRKRQQTIIEPIAAEQGPLSFNQSLQWLSRGLLRRSPPGG